MRQQIRNNQGALSVKNYLVTALIALVFGFAGAWLWSASGLGNEQTREYLVANPQILPEMADALQGKQAADRLAQIGDQVRTPFPGAVLGNPKGSKVLVKFTDYGCTYCRQSVGDVERLIRADPNLKVVIREWPIFEGSEDAARMALAAAAQNRYAPFHRALFALGSPTPENVDRAARQAGLDLTAATAFIKTDAVERELAQNMAFAKALGFTGTPSWIAGDEVVQGAVGYDQLAQALEIGGA